MDYRKLSRLNNTQLNEIQAEFEQAFENLKASITPSNFRDFDIDSNTQEVVERIVRRYVPNYVHDEANLLQMYCGYGAKNFPHIALDFCYKMYYIHEHRIRDIVTQKKTIIKESLKNLYIEYTVRIASARTKKIDHILSEINQDVNNILVKNDFYLGLRAFESGFNFLTLEIFTSFNQVFISGINNTLKNLGFKDRIEMRNGTILYSCPTPDMTKEKPLFEKTEEVFDIRDLKISSHDGKSIDPKLILDRISQNARLEAGNESL